MFHQFILLIFFCNTREETDDCFINLNLHNCRIIFRRYCYQVDKILSVQKPIQWYVTCIVWLNDSLNEHDKSWKSKFRKIKMLKMVSISVVQLSCPHGIPSIIQRAVVPKLSDLHSTFLELISKAKIFRPTLPYPIENNGYFWKCYYRT